MAESTYVLGVDFGTDSVRALIVDARSGEELVSHVSTYKRWSEGRYCDPDKNQFRQHPLDYIEGLESAVRNALTKLPQGSGKNIVGMGIDTTGSTPCLVDEAGRPLALSEAFTDNPNAMFILWKDHTAIAEAEDIILGHHYVAVTTQVFGERTADLAGLGFVHNEQQDRYLSPASPELRDTLRMRSIPFEPRIIHDPSRANPEKLAHLEAVQRWFKDDWKRIEPKLRTSIVEGISVFLSLFDDNP